MEACLRRPRGIWRRILFFAARVSEPDAARLAEVSAAFDTYGTAVLRAATAYLHNRADAEDVLQETFVRRMQSAPKCESAEHEKAWLLRVAINLSKNRLASGWVKHTQEIPENLPFAEREQLSFVWDAVAALPPKYRAPIHLIYPEGYTGAEIAAILRMKESTVRSLLHRARELLKTSLREEYDFDDEI